MSIILGPVLVLLLAASIPAASATSLQDGNMTASEIIDLVGNATDSGVELEDDDSQIASDTDASNDTNIVINEVELNPRGNDVGKEWIELYNPTDTDANISDFEIRTSFKSATITLPSGAEIEAGGTYMIELDRQTLSNTAETLVLEDADGQVMDRTPSLVDWNDDGRTWQRIPDGNSEWQFVSGTRDELNDPDDSRNATYGSANDGLDAECLGSAGCAEGVVTRIVDGDTVYVRVNSTVFKVDLALVNAPSRTEDGFIEATSYTRSLCLGDTVLVDQDDELLTSDTSIIAVVYCSSSNLNDRLLERGYAELDVDQCETSEFTNQRWARDHGC